MRKKTIYLLTLLFLLRAAPALAQDSGERYSERDYARKPLWGALMDDTLSNFFEVEKAYTIYFRHHELPEGEHDDIGEYAARERVPSRRKQRKIAREDALRMEVKRYLWWREQMLPYVQPDGRILTPSERLAIRSSQQAH